MEGSAFQVRTQLAARQLALAVKLEGGAKLERVGGRTLHCLALVNSLDELLSRCELLPDEQAFEELAYQEKLGGRSPMHWVLHHNASLAVVSKMWSRMKGDVLARNLFSLADSDGQLPLHRCAMWTTDVDALNFVISKFPAALLWKDRLGLTPWHYANEVDPDREKHDAVVFFLL